MGPHLRYSDYVRDWQILTALRLPTCPQDAPPELCPTPPPDWRPGDRWPDDAGWPHEEVLFIRTHQAFEVWFALVIHELEWVLVEAETIWRTHGSALPRIDMAAREQRLRDGRSADGASLVRLPGQFVAASAVRKGAVASDPGLEAAFAPLGAPCRLVQESGLPGAGVADVVGSLARWTLRLERARRALLVTIPFFDVLSTMTSAQFLKFRARLEPASGFGSTQFREIECLFGLREIMERRLRPPGGEPHGDPGEPELPPGMLRPTHATPGPLRLASTYYSQPPWGWHRIVRRHAAVGLRDLAYALLNLAAESGGKHPALGGVTVGPAEVDGLLSRVLATTLAGARLPHDTDRLDEGSRAALRAQILEADDGLAQRETVVAALLEQADEVCPLSALLRAVLALDGTLLSWRDRHIRFVEEQIGARPGTGGGGISYLRATTQGSFHLSRGVPCLWTAKTFVQRAASGPARS